MLSLQVWPAKSKCLLTAQLLEHSLLEVAQMKYVPDDPFPDELEKREGLLSDAA